MSGLCLVDGAGLVPGRWHIEWNPYGATCYGKSTTGMVAWIKAFSDEYHARTSRLPVIYTATSWWSQCTGNHGDFSSTNPLWVARYSSTVGTLPFAWGVYTIWQYADAGGFPGDQTGSTALTTGCRRWPTADPPLIRRDLVQTRPCPGARLHKIIQTPFF